MWTDIIIGSNWIDDTCWIGSNWTGDTCEPIIIELVTPLELVVIVEPVIPIE